MIPLWAAASASPPPAPDPFAPCEQQAPYFAAQVRPRPERPPALWWAAEDPCPGRTALDGAPPPAGTELHCLDRRGRLWGRETLFSSSGDVYRESRWRNDLEIGPRFDWDCRGEHIARRSQLSRGELDGEVAEWLGDGGVMVSTWRAGLKSGPTWKLDGHGQVVLIERWVSGVRNGRACAWRAGEWMSTVYSAGLADP